MIEKIDSVKFIYKGKVNIDKITKNKIQVYWEGIQQKKSFLHESKILTVTDFIKDVNDYTIELKETTFSNYMYTKNVIHGDVKSLFSGAYILTADEKLVCVLNHYYENELDFETINLVGGMADTIDLEDEEYSCEKCLRREFKEELGFNLDDEQWSIKLRYLKYPSHKENAVGYSIGTIYEIKTSYTAEQLELMFKEIVHDDEVNRLLFFSKDNYKEIYKLKHKKQYLPELFEMIFE